MSIEKTERGGRERIEPFLWTQIEVVSLRSQMNRPQDLTPVNRHNVCQYTDDDPYTPIHI